MTVTIDSSLALATLSSLETPRLKEAFESIGALLVARAKDNIAQRTGPAGVWPSGPWTELYGGQRTWNDISRSLNASATDDSVAIGATHVAAGVRQFGTIGAGGKLPDIVPTKKKALTIPINDAASRASYQGIDAKTAFPDSFILKPQHGASPTFLGVVARKIGGRTNKKTGVKENQKLDLLYLLVGRVAIRPHPFLPIDGDGKLAPASLWNEIEELIVNNFVRAA